VARVAAHLLRRLVLQVEGALPDVGYDPASCSQVFQVQGFFNIS
jgi:hypothetical protein